MVASSPAAFAAAVAEHPFGDVDLDPDVLARAAATLAECGLLVVGEPHGVRETPSVLYALASALGTRAVALEWSHEEIDDALREFMERGSFDFERLWTLPTSAEFFCGDGRIAAGHFALLERLRLEDRLEQVIAFDRLDPEPAPDDWRVRDRELAERLLAVWDRRLPLLVLTGAFHADAAARETMAARLSGDLPGLRPTMLQYSGGRCRSRGVHDLSEPMPAAPITIRLADATPAVVPGPAAYRPRP